MTGYVYTPGSPLPKRWVDAAGEIRLLMTTPAEGYVMARRRGAAPFVISVRDLLDGRFMPVQKLNNGERHGDDR